MIKEYEQNYAVKDKQDLLAMCALHFGSQKMEIDKKELIEDEGFEERLEKLNAKILENT